MSVNHNLTIVPAVGWSEDQLPLVEARLRSLLAVEGAEEAFSTSDYSGLDVDGSLVHLWFENRWTIESLFEVGRRISRSYLFAVVEVTMEWDTRDADEPGKEMRRYRDGERVATGHTELVVQDANGIVSVSGQPIATPMQSSLIGTHVFGGSETAGHDRAWELLTSYASRSDIDDDMAVVVEDIVTDLLHLAHRQGLDFDEIYTKAISRRDEEKD